MVACGLEGGKLQECISFGHLNYRIARTGQIVQDTENGVLSSKSWFLKYPLSHSVAPTDFSEGYSTGDNRQMIVIPLLLVLSKNKYACKSNEQKEKSEQLTQFLKDMCCL